MTVVVPFTKYIIFLSNVLSELNKCSFYNSLIHLLIIGKKIKFAFIGGTSKPPPLA